MEQTTQEQSPVPWNSPEVTHNIGFTSYVDAVLLGVCLLICLYAAGRKMSPGIAACCAGFLLLTLKFVSGMWLVSTENPIHAVIHAVEWLSSVGLALLAVGLWLQVAQPNASPQDSATDQE